MLSASGRLNQADSTGTAFPVQRRIIMCVWITLLVQRQRLRRWLQNTFDTKEGDFLNARPQVYPDSALAK